MDIFVILYVKLTLQIVRQMIGLHGQIAANRVDLVFKSDIEKSRRFLFKDDPVQVWCKRNGAEECAIVETK